MRPLPDDICGETCVLAGHPFVCIKPPHDWPGDPYGAVARWRAAHGQVSAPERHYFVPRERVEQLFSQDRSGSDEV